MQFVLDATLRPLPHPAGLQVLDNRFCGNQQSGIKMMDAACVHLDSNEVHSNKVGVWIEGSRCARASIPGLRVSMGEGRYLFTSRESAPASGSDRSCSSNVFTVNEVSVSRTTCLVEAAQNLSSDLSTPCILAVTRRHFLPQAHSGLSLLHVAQSAIRATRAFGKVTLT